MNRIDASLSYYIQQYPNLLLISPVDRKNSQTALKASKEIVSMPARSIEEVKNVPDTVRKNIIIILLTCLKNIKLSYKWHFLMPVHTVDKRNT